MLSTGNLLLMRAFAAAYRDAEIVKQPVSQLPWGHIVRLLQRVKDPATRDWYARQCVLNAWSRAVLELEIDRQAHMRQGKAINNFNLAMSPDQSDLAAAIFKDPYVFDFLGTADARREREVEQALVDHVQKFLLELGAGFAFVGRQVHLEIGEHDFYVDLLFFHLKLRCFVVIEPARRAGGQPADRRGDREGARREAALSYAPDGAYSIRADLPRAVTAPGW